MKICAGFSPGEMTLKLLMSPQFSLTQFNFIYIVFFLTTDNNRQYISLMYRNIGVLNVTISTSYCITDIFLKPVIALVDLHYCAKVSSHP